MKDFTVRNILFYDDQKYIIKESWKGYETVRYNIPEFVDDFSDELEEAGLDIEHYTMEELQNVFSCNRNLESAYEDYYDSEDVYEDNSIFDELDHEGYCYDDDGYFYITDLGCAFVEVLAINEKGAEEDFYVGAWSTNAETFNALWGNATEFDDKIRYRAALANQVDPLLAKHKKYVAAIDAYNTLKKIKKEIQLLKTVKTGR